LAPHSFFCKKTHSWILLTRICSFLVFWVNIGHPACGLRPSTLILVNRGAALRTVSLIA
jgi:hypothetical protein